MASSVFSRTGPVLSNSGPIFSIWGAALSNRGRTLLDYGADLLQHRSDLIHDGADLGRQRIYPIAEVFTFCCIFLLVGREPIPQKPARRTRMLASPTPTEITDAKKVVGHWREPFFQADYRAMPSDGGVSRPTVSR